MEAVSKRGSARAALALLSVLLLVLAAWFVRDATFSLSDSEVRHGVMTRAVVLATDGDVATVRIPLPDADVVTDIEAHRNYAAGDTVAVIYDATDPTRASAQGAPTPSSPVSRGLLVAGLCAVVVTASLLVGRRATDDTAAEHTGTEVRGGRAVEPARARF